MSPILSKSSKHSGDGDDGDGGDDGSDGDDGSNGGDVDDGDDGDNGDGEVDVSAADGPIGAAGMYIGHTSFRNMFKEAMEGGCMEVRCHTVNVSRMKRRGFLPTLSVGWRKRGLSGWCLFGTHSSCWQRSKWSRVRTYAGPLSPASLRGMFLVLVKRVLDTHCCVVLTLFSQWSGQSYRIRLVYRAYVQNFGFIFIPPWYIVGGSTLNVLISTPSSPIVRLSASWHVMAGALDKAEHVCLSGRASLLPTGGWLPHVL